MLLPPPLPLPQQRRVGLCQAGPRPPPSGGTTTAPLPLLRGAALSRALALLWRPPSLPPQDCTCRSAASRGGNFVPLAVCCFFTGAPKQGVFGRQGSTVPVVLGLTAFPSRLPDGWVGAGGRSSHQKHHSSLALGPFSRVEALPGPRGPSLGFDWGGARDSRAPRLSCRQLAYGYAPGADIL